MRIVRLDVECFRCFGLTPVSIRFPNIPDPISIIGHNNSGKTNLVAALLHGLGVRSSYPTAFSEHDFFQCDLDNKPDILIQIAPPLLSTNAFNQITEMPLFHLKIYSDDGSIETKHDCCDENGKAIYNARATKRSKSRVYTEEEREVLNEYLRTGAERVHKWRSKVPVFYLGPETLGQALKTTRYSLLGKVIESFRKEFDDSESVMLEEEGVVPSHVGKPRTEIYTQAMEYIESHVIPTIGFRAFVDEVEAVVREQLDIEDESFGVRFRPPEVDFFFKNLRFDVRENDTRPLIPADKMGSGFLSLFVVALLRVLVDTDEGGKIFILEEPETYLHEHFQEYFYTVLCQLAEQNQVIYTTHSKKFVNLFKPETIIRLATEAEGSRAIIPSKESVEFPDEISGYQLKSPDDFAKYMRTLEPNIGNVVFASRVLVVEGPHDLLAYRTVLSTVLDLGLKNTAIVSAWGKDPILTIVQVCRALEIPCFVIHDRDLPNELTDDAEDLTPAQKAQRTKKRAIAEAAGDLVHVNRPNLEGVLGIPPAEKSPTAVFERLEGKTLKQVQDRFPDLIPESLIEFVGVDD